MWNVEECEIMIITKTHVKFWQSRQVPSWAKGVLTIIPVTLDSAINEHVLTLVKPNRNKEMNQHNSIGLLKLVRKNQAYDRKYGRPDTLLAYIHNYNQQDGRLPIYRRWERKYAKKMLASVLSTIT